MALPNNERLKTNIPFQSNEKSNFDENLSPIISATRDKSLGELFSGLGEGRLPADRDLRNAKMGAPTRLINICVATTMVVLKIAYSVYLGET